METVKQQLADWTDADGAQHCLALWFGLVTSQMDFCTLLKHVYSSSNPVVNMLHACLQEPVKAVILEEDCEGRYRWNPSFNGFVEHGNMPKLTVESIQGRESRMPSLCPASRGTELARLTMEPKRCDLPLMAMLVERTVLE